MKGEVMDKYRGAAMEAAEQFLRRKGWQELVVEDKPYPAVHITGEDMGSCVGVVVSVIAPELGVESLAAMAESDIVFAREDGIVRGCDRVDVVELYVLGDGRALLRHEMGAILGVADDGRSEDDD